MTNRKLSTTDSMELLLYPHGKSIEIKKITHHKELLPYVPPDNHAFYNNLKTIASAEDRMLVTISSIIFFVWNETLLFPY